MHVGSLRHPRRDEVITIDMSLDVLGIGQPADTGIFDFFKALPTYILKSGMEFTTPQRPWLSIVLRGARYLRRLFRGRRRRRIHLAGWVMVCRRKTLVATGFGGAYPYVR